MRNARHLYRYVLTGGALVALSCAPSGAWAQQSGSQEQAQVQAQETSQTDLAAFDDFLDANQGIATQLIANPALASNKDFLNNHPQLQDFLNDHPKIQQQITSNPDAFMDGLAKFEHSRQDRAEDRGNSPNRGNNGNQNPDLTRREVASMDQFLDSHQDIERQLEQNPSLINDQTFLQNHPGLQTFLKDHPQIQAEFAENPQFFILRVNRYEKSPADQRADNDVNRTNNRNQNPDLTRREVASMDQFLDSHEDIERQLEQNPSLISNQTFLQNHPQLQTFLTNHPQIQAEFAENPQFFMLRTNRFENSPADQRADNNQMNNGNNNPNNLNTANEGNRNPDLNRGEVASMDQFLDSHDRIERELKANPSLINNVDYLKKHQDLRAFLSSHPAVREEFTENPSLFMNREGQYERTEFRPGTDRDMNQRDVATMDAYLDKHAGEARDLEAYPARVNDSDYLEHHKDLDSFLKKHPQVREEFTENPREFMGAESAFEANSEMDEFLDAHKKVAKDLDENPGRVKDNDYLKHHKDLDSFLDKNPGVKDQFMNDPDSFMRSERRSDADREMDVYLTKHRNVAKDLDKDPDRVKDDKYLDHHKDLKELLDKHPDMEQQARTNPSEFMKERAKFHQDFENQKMHQKTKVEERATTHSH